MAVARPRPVVEPIALGSERQLDRDADERAEIAVLDALSARVARTVAEIRARVPYRYRWQVVELLGALAKAGKARVVRRSPSGGGPLVARWRRR